MSANKALKRAWAVGDPRAGSIQGGEKLPLITDTTEWITPEIALAMLQRNRKNRPVNWRRVDEYASIMKQGKWKLTAQGIVLDGEGNILTGQKRLLAVTRANCAVPFRISRGNESSTATLLDRGDPQSARDLAARETERKHSPTESSIARAIAVGSGVPHPTVDELGAIMADYSSIMVAMLNETKGTKKGRAHLMIMAAVAIWAKGSADSDVAAAVQILRLGTYVGELEKRLAPEKADRCWGKGAAFTLAMRTAREVVS